MARVARKTAQTNWPAAASKYLNERGVTLASAKAAGINYIDAELANELVGKLEDKRTSDGLKIPFPGTSTFTVRFLAENSKPKFKNPRGAVPRFYLPPSLPWGEIKKKKLRVFITEGPIKALCAAAHKLPVIALDGVWNWKSGEPIEDFKAFNWKDRPVVLVFDSDVVQKHDVQRALAELADYLTSLGAVVSVRLFDSKTKVGLDDYLVKHGVAKFNELETLLWADKRFKHWGINPVTDELNQTLALVTSDPRALILREVNDQKYPGTKKIILSRSADVELIFKSEPTVLTGYKPDGAPIYKSKYQVWLNDKHRRNVFNLSMKPGSPWGVDTQGDFNLWQGWPLQPKKGSWAKMRQHILEVIADGNKTHAEYIINWIAYGIQNLDRVPEVALVTIGGEGTGKGILWENIVKLYGRHGILISTPDQFTGKYNEHLQDKLFVFLDEAFFAGDKQAANAMKRLITSHTMQIEPKFVNSYSMPNYMKIAMSSNESWVVPADIDARRFAVFRVSEKRKDDWNYFAAIGKELNNGGLAAMLFDLQQRDLSKFEIRKMPITEEFLNQKKLSMDEIKTWWFECLLAGRITGDKWEQRVSYSVIQTQVSAHLHGRFSERGIATKIGMELKQMCPKVGTVQQFDGSGHHFRSYLFPTLDACRAAFESVLKTKVNWQTGNMG